MPHRHLSGLIPGSVSAAPVSPTKRSTTRPSTSASRPSTSDGRGHSLTSLRRRSIDWYSLRIGSAPLTPPTSPEEPHQFVPAAFGANDGQVSMVTSPTKAVPSSQPTSPLSPPPTAKPFRMPSLGNMARQSGLSRFARRSTASSERIGAGAREATQQRERDNVPMPFPSSSGQGSSSSGAPPRLEQLSAPSLRSMRNLDRDAERKAASTATSQTVDRERRSPQTLDSPTSRGFGERCARHSGPPSNDEPPHRLVQHSSQPEVSTSSRTSPRLPRLGRRPKTAESRAPAKFGFSEVLNSSTKRSSPRPRTNTLNSASTSPRLGEGADDLLPENAIGLSASASGPFTAHANDSPPAASLRSRSSLHRDRSMPSGHKESRNLSPRISMSGLSSAGIGLGIDFDGGGGAPGRDDESYMTVRSPGDGHSLHRQSDERLCSIECFGESYAKQVTPAVGSSIAQGGLTPPPRPRRKSKAPGHHRHDSTTSSTKSSSWSTYTKAEESKGPALRRAGHHRLRLSIAEGDKWDDRPSSSHSRSSSSSSATVSTLSSSRGGLDPGATTVGRRSARKAPPTPLRLSTLSEDDLSAHVAVAASFLETVPQQTPDPTPPSLEPMERRAKPSLLLPVSPPLSPTVTTDAAVAHADHGLRERIDHLKFLRQQERDLRDTLRDAGRSALGSSPQEVGSALGRAPHSSLTLTQALAASPAASLPVSLPSNDGWAEGDDLEDYWSMESHSFTAPSSMSLSTSPSSISDNPIRRMSPPLAAVVPLTQPKAPVPPQGHFEAGLSQEESLRARLRWFNEQIIEACRTIATAAMRFVLEDGVPPYLDSARSAKAFSILRDPRLAALEAERRHHYLHELLLHLVLSTLHSELCQPFCYGYSRDDTSHATRLLNMVWSQTPTEAATVQRTLHLSMRQSLAPHLRSAYRSNVRAKLHSSIGLLFAWAGLAAKPSDGNLHIAKGHAALKAAIEELGLIVDDAREAGPADGATISPELPTSMLASSAASRTKSAGHARSLSAVGQPSNYGAFEICIADDKTSSQGLVIAKGLGLAQRTSASSSTHRVLLQPRWAAILDS